MTLAEEFLPDFDGKVTVFMVEVISQNQDEWFGWVNVFRYLTFSVGGDVVETEGDRLDSIRIKSRGFLVEAFGNVFADRGDAVNAEGNPTLHSTVGSPSFGG